MKVRWVVRAMAPFTGHEHPGLNTYWVTKVAENGTPYDSRRETDFSRPIHPRALVFDTRAEAEAVAERVPWDGFRGHVRMRRVP